MLNGEATLSINLGDPKTIAHGLAHQAILFLLYIID
jgi:hypothetical protein